MNSSCLSASDMHQERLNTESPHDLCAEEGLRLLRATVSLEGSPPIVQNDATSDSKHGLFKHTARELASWIKASTDHTSSIIWLTGLSDRSALQQIIEMCRHARQLAASFSFSSRKGAEQAKEFFPSLAYQIAINIPRLRSAIGLALFRDPNILSKNADIQFASLLLGPFDELDSVGLLSTRPVVIIEAIELHHDPAAQKLIVSLIEVATTSVRVPLRFIFASRSSDYAPPFHRATHIHMHNCAESPLRHGALPGIPTPRNPASPPHESRGFPKLVQTQYSIGVAESYSRSLMMQGHGIPLWSPHGSLDRPLAHIEEGVHIGDVMLLDSKGSYAFLFNIFRDKNDPIQNRVIPGYFRPIYPPLDPSEVNRMEHYFAPGAVITSPGVSATKISHSPLRIHFESKRQEGGALVLPEGGSREDLVSTHRFYPYLKKWAPYWYNMIPITNGSLFLVTGCDKVSDYAALCFPYTRPSCKKASPSISMDYIYGEDHEYSPWRKRSGDGGGIWHSPIDCEPTRGGTWPQGSQSLCVFVRGIRIALCESTWSSAIGGLSGVEKDFYTTVLQKTPPLDYATTSVLARLHRRFSETDALNELPVVRKQPVHPIFLLGPLLLRKYPKAILALVDDAIWCSLVNKQETASFDALSALVDIVLEQYTATHQDGMVFLSKKAEHNRTEPVVKTSSPSLRIDRYGKLVPISQYAAERLGLPNRRDSIM